MPRNILDRKISGDLHTISPGGGGTEHYWSDTEEKQAKERKDTINNLEASDKTIPRELESFSREDVLARGNEQSPQQ